MGVAGSNRHNPRPRTSAAAANGASATRRRRSKRQSRAAARDAAAPMPKPLVFTIPSDFAASRDVHKTIMDRVEAQHYDEQSTFAIRLALEEGLINAIKHGNKLDPKKTVHVEAKVTPKATEITIEDEGKGFHRDGRPRPLRRREPAQVLRPRHPADRGVHGQGRVHAAAGGGCGW